MDGARGRNDGLVFVSSLRRRVRGVTRVNGQVKVRVGAVKVFGVQGAESQRG
jgi:hypothetical protein